MERDQEEEREGEKSRERGEIGKEKRGEREIRGRVEGERAKDRIINEGRDETRENGERREWREIE